MRLEDQALAPRDFADARERLIAAYLDGNPHHLRDAPSSPPFDADDDAVTLLTAEERERLIPTYITLRHELNEAEQIGNEEANRWAFGRKRDVLDERS